MTVVMPQAVVNAMLKTPIVGQQPVGDQKPKKETPTFKADLAYDLSVVSPFDTILLWGDSGSGKTAQVGEMIKSVWKTEKKRTRYAMSDRGGLATIEHLLALKVPSGEPLVEVVPMFGDPWLWLNHTAKGDLFDQVTKRWIPGLKPDIGLWVFEGMKSDADALMSWLADAAGKGKDIGGGGAFNFKVEGVGETLTIGTNNMSHYQVAQRAVVDIMWTTQRLPGTLLWTSGTQRGEDDSKNAIVGAGIVGRKGPEDLPRWTKYTFRIAAEPQPNAMAKHTLYLDHSKDISTGNALCVSNSRLPLDGAAEAPVEFKMTPADLPRALAMIKKRKAAAMIAAAKELGL